MRFNEHDEDFLPNITLALWWALTIIPSAIIIGAFTTVFIWLTDQVTLLRYHHLWLLYLLPLAGIATYAIIRWARETTSAFSITDLHIVGANTTDKSVIVLFVTTVLTHLTGGSAGRIGPVFQMGACIARLSEKMLRLDRVSGEVICSAGIAAAFGACFGTPLAGAIFALEIIRPGKFPINKLLPCLAASATGYFVNRYMGLPHAVFSSFFGTDLQPHFSASYKPELPMMLCAAAVGLAMGLITCIFWFASQQLSVIAHRVIRRAWVLPLIGGSVLILFFLVTGDAEPLGLGVTGVTGIQSAFAPGGGNISSCLLKLVLTVITLSFAFRGGEITPLLFIATAFCNVVAVWLHLAVAPFVSLGFVAILAASLNAPLAATLLGAELFGTEYFVYYAIACFMAYFFSPVNNESNLGEFKIKPKIIDGSFVAP